MYLSGTLLHFYSTYFQQLKTITVKIENKGSEEFYYVNFFKLYSQTIEF